MNNYSFLQQKLHQFALSTQLMREVSFDVEKTFTLPATENEHHVFVAGLARSGSTILLNAIHKSDQFASLSYLDMPFILAPNLWSKITFKEKATDMIDRAHGDGIKISTDSPEAFEEVFWKTFCDKEVESVTKFKTYVQLINHKYQKERYLSKNNQNIKRIELISKIFPHSIILIPFREPIQHAYSLLTNHQKFIHESQNDKFISDYMKWIGHTEFGPNYTPIHSKNIHFKDHFDINHWIEQWYRTYNNSYKSLSKDKNVIFICYEKLCKSKEYWLQIIKILKIKEDYCFKFTKSSKQVSLEINNKLSKQTSLLYDQLSNLTFK
jgi:hypothetical protein